MPIICKFAKNCRVGDFVIPGGGEPMLHSYWKIVEITTDHVRYEAGSRSSVCNVVGNLNDVVMVRPDAPKFINAELLDEYYGPNGRYSPWPWDWKNKSSAELKTEVGEDMTSNVYRKWYVEAMDKKRELAKMERPELVIRTMHDRAVRDYCKNTLAEPEGLMVCETEAHPEREPVSCGSCESHDRSEPAKWQ